MSGVDYGALMAAVVQKLTAVAATRHVTRSYMDFNHRAEADLADGVYTVIAGGVRSYPWDHTDSADADFSGRGATALPVFQFRVLGQGFIAGESVTGEDIEAAEFAMLAEIETLADELVRDETLDEHEQLCRCVLQGVDQSSQLEAPYFWIAALFALEVR